LTDISCSAEDTDIEALEAGTIDEDELPMYVLTVLLSKVDNIELDDDMILRETAFFLVSLRAANRDAGVMLERASWARHPICFDAR